MSPDAASPSSASRSSRTRTTSATRRRSTSQTGFASPAPASARPIPRPSRRPAGVTRSSTTAPRCSKRARAPTRSCSRPNGRSTAHSTRSRCAGSSPGGRRAAPGPIPSSSTGGTCSITPPGGLPAGASWRSVARAIRFRRRRCLRSGLRSVRLRRPEPRPPRLDERDDPVDDEPEPDRDGDRAEHGEEGLVAQDGAEDGSDAGPGRAPSRAPRSPRAADTGGAGVARRPTREVHRDARERDVARGEDERGGAPQHDLAEPGDRRSRAALALPAPAVDPDPAPDPVAGEDRRVSAPTAATGMSSQIDGVPVDAASAPSAETATSLGMTTTNASATTSP